MSDTVHLIVGGVYKEAKNYKTLWKPEPYNR